ncbi:MAG TPA: hypothetical protein VG406_22470 [Isosphaeraceae bacterium]|jgi:hypothetical protein|nr:hypothetical protein [Isosphaeraceae bacterium]
MRNPARLLAATAVACGLGAGAALAEGPMSGISTKMTGVAGDLSKTITGEPVQVKQKEIVRDLDELIAQLEKECAACRGGRKKANPSRPLADSVIKSGPGGMGNLANPGPGQKDWAKLSARERDRILQSMSEGFPPEYRTVLERYYRRLAEEKGAATDAAPKPKAGDPQADKK